MASVYEVVQMWEHAISQWRAGDDRLPSPLDVWRASYQGQGVGAVDLTALPEPYLGSWDRARAAMLAVHAGQVLERFQHRGGVFDREIAKAGSYTVWAARWPYVNPPWTDEHPPVRHTTARLRFLRDWFDEPELPYEAMLGVELYPWHVTSATTPMRPDPRVVRDFVWGPLVDAQLEVVFAFGAPWFEMLTEHLDLEVIKRLGEGGADYRSRVQSRAVLLCEAPSGLRIIAEKHLGSAGPPATDETHRLRDAVRHVSSAWER